MSAVEPDPFRIGVMSVDTVAGNMTWEVPPAYAKYVALLPDVFRSLISNLPDVHPNATYGV